MTWQFRSDGVQVFNSFAFFSPMYESREGAYLQRFAKVKDRQFKFSFLCVQGYNTRMYGVFFPIYAPCVRAVFRPSKCVTSRLMRDYSSVLVLLLFIFLKFLTLLDTGEVQG